MQINNQFIFKLVSVAFVIFFVEYSRADESFVNLNSESTLDLINEPILNNPRLGSSDAAEFGYMSRELGRPRLKTPSQITEYNFSEVMAPLFGYRVQVSEGRNMFWSNRISYSSVEESSFGLLPNRLHLVPLQSEVLWQMRKGTVSPFVALGVVGILQLQRGAQQVRSSELDGLWAFRMGMDFGFKDVAINPWGLSLSWQEQKSWAKRGHDWSGSGFDLSVSVAL